MFQRLLKKLASELNKNNIPYMVIGGQAVLIYGEPRLTKDIDIILGVGPEKLNQVKVVVKKLGLKILTNNIENFVRQTMVIPVLDEKSDIRIDFIFSFTPYEQQAINRAKKINILNALVNFASLEDLIIFKIIARRERDIEDVRLILLKNNKYDKHYIVKWLKEFDDALNENFLQIFFGLLKHK